MHKGQVSLVVVAFNEVLDSVFCVDGALPTLPAKATVEEYTASVSEYLAQFGLQVEEECGTSILGVIFYVEDTRHEVSEGYGLVNVSGEITKETGSWVAIDNLEDVLQEKYEFVHMLVHGEALFMSVVVEDGIPQWNSSSRGRSNGGKRSCKPRRLKAEHLKALLEPSGYNDLQVGLA